MTAPRLEQVDFATDSLPGDELHDVLAEARAEGPVVDVTFYGGPAYLITRFAELRDFFGAQEEFPGGVIYEFSTRPHIGNTLINIDGPMHNTYRHLATPFFRSRATARFVDQELTPLAHEVIDRFAGQGRADLATAFAQVLPFWSISRKLGLPVGSEEQHRAWALDLLSYPSEPERALKAAADVATFLAPVVEARRVEPRDDVISSLLSGEHEGVRLSDEEVYAHIRLIYAVGATTTSDGLSTVLHRLLAEPTLAARARQDPALLSGIVHESLRVEPPVSVLPRLARDGGTVAGVDVPPGATVLCGIASANRDVDVFDGPEHFDPERAESEILTFGFGSKFCPGMHMARQQILAAAEVLLERLPDLRLVRSGEPTGSVLRRVESLEVSW